jgi:hypothetical protein
MRLVTFTPMAWEIDHRDFTNRVNHDAVCTSAFELPLRYNRAADSGRNVHGLMERPTLMLECADE